MIINVTGMKGSGKTTALEYFRNIGFDSFEIYGEYNRLKSDKKLSKYEYGKDGVWDDTQLKAVDNHILKDFRYYIAFLGGLLRPQELDYLKSVDIVYTLNVDGGDAKERFSRVKRRGRDNEASYDFHDFIKRDRNRLGLSQGYEDNDLGRIIHDSDIIVENKGSAVAFESNLRESLVKLGAMIQGDNNWYERDNKYLNLENQILFTIEGMLGDRKNIIGSLPTVSSALSIGCGLGGELELVSAYSKKGVDMLPKHFFDNRNFDYESADFNDIKDDAELVTMLRTASTKSDKSYHDLNKAIGMSGRYLLLSYARAGIMKDGTIKKFNHSTDGRPIKDLISDTYGSLSKHGNVYRFSSEFEDFFLLDKNKK